MTASAPNGLASLSAQRERARRSMPPPRHPIPPDAAAPAEASSPSPAELDGGFTEKPPLMPGPTPPAPSPEATGATFKVTLYVDRQTDEFMEATRVEGLMSRPKVDVSRSAVVRLALRRLMDEMSTAEVKALLERQAVRSTGPGRKRR